MAEDPKKISKKDPAWKDWDGMVEKADGSVGKWGNAIKPQRYKAAKAKLYPSGEVNQSDIDSLKKAGRGKLIGEPIKTAGQPDMYGTAASDVIKQLTKRK